MSNANAPLKPAGRGRNLELPEHLKSYKGVWVFIEHDRGQVHSVSWELMGEARKLADKLGVSVAGVVMGGPDEKLDDFAKEAYTYGADSCYVMRDPVLKGYRNEPFTKGMTDLVNQYQPEILLLGATTMGRDLAGSVATTLATGLTADCTELRIDPAMQAPFMAAVQRTPIAASGSWVLDGELTRVIGDLLDTFGLEWKVINGQVIFLERGITASSQGQAAALLAPSTGLLEWSPTDAGLALTALAQPSIRPGSQIVVRDGFGRPVGAPGFRVESVRFTGSTFTGESIMTIEARRSVPL